MSCGTCTGACCAVFEFLDPAHPDFHENTDDSDYIADMLVPLNLVQATERMERFGVSYWAEMACHDWDGYSLDREGRRLYTCRHWNEETRLCGAYESRPTMCREYPYYADDCDYRCGYTLSFEEKWNRALRLRGPEGGTPSNIVRGYN